MMSEQDPNGINQHAPGAKLDQGKLQAYQLLSCFPKALTAIIEVAQFGANKYTIGGWQSVPNGNNRYQDAELRHKLKRWAGEIVDSDSGLPHRYHEVWNALAALEMSLREVSNDPRD